jgi:anti-anti-sigma factor
MNELARLATEQHGDVTVATVRGELDISNATETGDAIAAGLDNSARGLVVDFSELEFLDSSGISMLFALARRLADRRQELHLVAPKGAAVGRVLDIVEFDRAAPVHATRDDALAALGVTPGA